MRSLLRIAEFSIPQSAIRNELLLHQFEVAFGRAVIPRTGHHVLVELSIDHEMNGRTAAHTRNFGFHVNRARPGIERALLDGDRGLTFGSYVSGHRFAVKFKFGRNLIAVVRIRTPVTGPLSGNRIGSGLLLGERRSNA